MTSAPSTLHPYGPALLLGSAAFAVVYALAGPLGLPLVAYLPDAGEFTLSPSEGGPVMTYYGRLLDASLAFAAVYLAARVSRRPRPTRALVLGAGAAIVGSLLALVASELARVPGTPS